MQSQSSKRYIPLSSLFKELRGVIVPGPILKEKNLKNATGAGMGCAAGGPG